MNAKAKTLIEEHFENTVAFSLKRGKVTLDFARGNLLGYLSALRDAGLITRDEYHPAAEAINGWYLTCLKGVKF